MGALEGRPEAPLAKQLQVLHIGELELHVLVRYDSEELVLRVVLLSGSLKLPAEIAEIVVVAVIALEPDSLYRSQLAGVTHHSGVPDLQAFDVVVDFSQAGAVDHFKHILEELISRGKGERKDGVASGVLLAHSPAFEALPANVVVLANHALVSVVGEIMGLADVASHALVKHGGVAVQARFGEKMHEGL